MLDPPAYSDRNPSFKIQSTLLSRCRTFTLQKLTVSDIKTILERALDVEYPGHSRPPVLDSEMIDYLSAFAAGDARTALNLLDLTISMSTRADITKEDIKKSMTQTLVYDRGGDGRFDTMSAFHKSIRGSNPDAALYYLARMFECGEDPLWIARHLILIASDDIGIADNSLLPLATAAYSAAEKIGMPECRITLAHATVALARAKKSMSVFLGLASALAVLKEPGVSALAVPMHLRNVPAELMKGLEHEKNSKHTSDYKHGRFEQEVRWFYFSLCFICMTLAILKLTLWFGSIYLMFLRGGDSLKNEHDLNVEIDGEYYN